MFKRPFLEGCPDGLATFTSSWSRAPFDVVDLLMAGPANLANLQLSLTILRHRKRFRVTHQRNLGRERWVAPAILPRHWHRQRDRSGHLMTLRPTRFLPL